MQLNHPAANYCLKDEPEKCIHSAKQHCIKHICAFFKIYNPLLKCDIFFTEEEKTKIKTFTSTLDKKFVVIEPHSKKDYTPNKEYSFEKWQKVVDELSKHIQVVQVGNKEGEILDNVVDLTGKTSFREAAGIIGDSSLLISTEGGLIHAATAVYTTSLVVHGGFSPFVLWSYPQNINIRVGGHGPCGYKIPCAECREDVENHNESEIVEKALDFLKK